MYFKSKRLGLAKLPHSPHMIVPQLVTEKTKVLDVGCNAGYIGRLLKESKQCLCDGIDIDKKLLRLAKPYYRSLYEIDLYQDKFTVSEKYDFILFIDILEHLPTPEKILKKLIKENLDKGGKVIICLPNVARFELRLKHLFGNFDYMPGIMNEDHLKFYTLKTGKEMIKECGLKIEKILPTGLGHYFKVLPSLIAFQFIYVCSKQ